MPERTLRPAFYPFSAVYGADMAQKALMCAMVNPRIKGVLITGPSGVAKTSIARSLANDTFGQTIVNIPLNVTEEQLFGCLDIEAAIKDGTMVIQEGILHRANGNRLYMDDLNLFDQKTVISIMNSVMDGKVIVERENLSAEYECETSVIATMNTSGGFINPRILDYFDICVQMRCPEDASGREEIISRNISFYDDPDIFANSYADPDRKVMEKVEKAAHLLPFVKISDTMIETVAEIASSMNMEGYRGDISMVNVCLALAALDGRSEISVSDVKEAAILCLSHRRKKSTPKAKDDKKERKEEDNSFGNSHMKRFIHDDRKIVIEETPDETIPEETAASDIPVEMPEVESVVFDVGETFESIDILNGDTDSFRGVGSAGKRMHMLSDDRSGKYVRSRITDKKNPDLAFDATVRAAAPHQVRRRAEKSEDRILIEKQDMREKIRERRSSCTFLFLVDTSGSLIIRSRMIAVKGAIMSLLKDHYTRRDSVGFMTFNEKAIDMLLPPTKSVDCIFKLLDSLPVGERTPLGAAMMRADDFMRTYVRKHPHEKCYVILVTDGKANVPVVEGADAVEESLRLAKMIDIPSTEWIVIDTNMKEGQTYSENLAKALVARYYSLNDLKDTST